MVGEVLPQHRAGLRVIRKSPHIALPHQQLRLAVAIDIEELHRIHVVVVVFEVLRVVPHLFAVRVQAKMADRHLIDAIAVYVVRIDVVAEVILRATFGMLP